MRHLKFQDPEKCDLFFGVGWGWYESYFLGMVDVDPCPNFRIPEVQEKWGASISDFVVCHAVSELKMKQLQSITKGLFWTASIRVQQTHSYEVLALYHDVLFMSVWVQMSSSFSGLLICEMFACPTSQCFLSGALPLPRERDHLGESALVHS